MTSVTISIKDELTIVETSKMGSSLGSKGWRRLKGESNTQDET
jgi:hypothetical protein